MTMAEIDFGTNLPVVLDARGIPEPPSWIAEMVERGFLTLITFDDGFDIAITSRDAGAEVVVSHATRTVSFSLGAISLHQFHQMAKSVIPKSALADARPLDADAAERVAVGQRLGDFQVFHFVTTESTVVLYARAVDTRFALRLVFLTREIFASFVVSLTAISEEAERQRQPPLERLNIPYTLVSSKNPIESPEALREAIRPVKSARGHMGGFARVGDAWTGMFPDELLSKYDQNGMLLPQPREPRRPLAAWMIVALVLLGAALAVAYHLALGIR